MHPGRKRAFLWGLALGVLLFMVLVPSFTSPAHAQSNSQNGVVVTVQETPMYDVFGSNVAHIAVEVSASSISLNQSVTLTILTNFRPTVNGSATVSGTSE